MDTKLVRFLTYLIVCLLLVILIKSVPLKLLFNFIKLSELALEYGVNILLNFLCILFSLYVIKKNDLKIYLLGKNQFKVIYILPLLVCVLIFTNFFANIREYNVFDIPFYIIYLYIAKTLIGAFFEELFFRGFVVSYSIKFLKKKHIICLISAIIFGIPHIINYFNQFYTFQSVLYQVILATSLGFLYASIYLKTKSLLLIILFHFINNFVANIEELFIEYNEMSFSIVDKYNFLEFFFETILILFIAAIPVFFGNLILKRVSSYDILLFKNKE